MKVTLYKSPTCPQCKVLKMKLEKKGIPFEEINDEAIMAQRGVKSIPQLEVDGVRYTTVGEANKWINAQNEVTNG